MVRSLVRLSFFVLVLAVGACGGDDARSALNRRGVERRHRGPRARCRRERDERRRLLGTYAVGVAETPADDSSMVDPAKCDMGLSTENVYFAPTPGEPGDLSTTCTMSADQTLLVVPTSAFCIDAPEAGGTADTACLDSLWDLTSSSLTIDGVEVEGLDAYEVDSEVIDVTLPEANVFEDHEVPAGPSRTIDAIGVDGDKSISCFARTKPLASMCERTSDATLPSGRGRNAVLGTDLRRAPTAPHQNCRRAQGRGDGLLSTILMFARGRRDPVRLLPIHLYLSETNANCDLLGSCQFGNGYVALTREDGVIHG